MVYAWVTLMSAKYPGHLSYVMASAYLSVLQAFDSRNMWYHFHLIYLILTFGTLELPKIYRP